MAVSTSDLFDVSTVNDLIVEPVFNQSVALSSGLQRLSTTSTTVHVPSVSGGSAGWFAELAPIGEAGIAADETAITPKKCAAVQTVSNESANDANAAQLVGQALTNALVQTVDSAFFTGSGAAPGPAGLPGITGFSTVSYDADAEILAYTDAIAEVEEAGGQAGAIYVSPATWASLSRITVETASTRPLLSPGGNVSEAAPRSLFGVPVHTSKYVPANTAWVLDPSRVIVVERAPATVDVDRSVKFMEDAAVLRAVMRLEFTAPIPGVVCRIAPVV